MIMAGMHFMGGEMPFRGGLHPRPGAGPGRQQDVEVQGQRARPHRPHRRYRSRKPGGQAHERV